MVKLRVGLRASRGLERAQFRRILLALRVQSQHEASGRDLRGQKVEEGSVAKAVPAKILGHITDVFTELFCIETKVLFHVNAIGTRGGIPVAAEKPLVKVIELAETLDKVQRSFRLQVEVKRHDDVSLERGQVGQRNLLLVLRVDQQDHVPQVRANRLVHFNCQKQTCDAESDDRWNKLGSPGELGQVPVSDVHSEVHCELSVALDRRDLFDQENHGLARATCVHLDELTSRQLEVIPGLALLLQHRRVR